MLGGVFDVDDIGLLSREVLRERMPVLIAETCAWSVGLSDRPHYVRRHGRIAASGVSLGDRAAADQPLSGEEDTRLEFGDARPGSFRDVLNALTAEGHVYADRFDEQVLAPFVLDTCVLAAERARDTNRQAWAELVDDLGEDGDDLVEVVRVAEWEAPLRTEAEQLVLAALGDAPLIELEAEGLPLSLVRAAEVATREAVAAGEHRAEEHHAPGDDLAGARFLAELALRDAGLPLPVPPTAAGKLLDALLAQGIEPDEVARLLPDLPVAPEAAGTITDLLADAGH